MTQVTAPNSGTWTINPQTTPPIALSHPILGSPERWHYLAEGAAHIVYAYQTAFGDLEEDDDDYEDDDDDDDDGSDDDGEDSDEDERYGRRRRRRKTDSRVGKIIRVNKGDLQSSLRAQRRSLGQNQKQFRNENERTRPDSLHLEQMQDRSGNENDGAEKQDKDMNVTAKSQVHERTPDKAVGTEQEISTRRVFRDEILPRLIPPSLLPYTEIVSVPLKWLHTLWIQEQSKRPANRREDIEIETAIEPKFGELSLGDGSTSSTGLEEDGGVVAGTEDEPSISIEFSENVTSSAADQVCIEIKPKWGFLPDPTWLPEESREIKMQHCRFCMHRQYKQRGREEKEAKEFQGEAGDHRSTSSLTTPIPVPSLTVDTNTSDPSTSSSPTFCPLDLYSTSVNPTAGEYQRPSDPASPKPSYPITRALEALISDWQKTDGLGNNFRLFMHSYMLQPRHLADFVLTSRTVSSIQKVLEQFLMGLMDPSPVSTSEDSQGGQMEEPRAQQLPRGNVFSVLKKLQVALDPFNIETIDRWIDEIANSTSTPRLEIMDILESEATTAELWELLDTIPTLSTLAPPTTIAQLRKLVLAYSWSAIFKDCSVVFQLPLDFIRRLPLTPPKGPLDPLSPTYEADRSEAMLYEEIMYMRHAWGGREEEVDDDDDDGQRNGGEVEEELEIKVKIIDLDLKPMKRLSKWIELDREIWTNFKNEPGTKVCQP